MRPTNVENADLLEFGVSLRRSNTETIRTPTSPRPALDAAVVAAPIVVSRSVAHRAATSSSRVHEGEMAVLPPMPSASVSTAVSAKTRAELSVRTRDESLRKCSPCLRRKRPLRCAWIKSSGLKPHAWSIPHSMQFGALPCWLVTAHRESQICFSSFEDHFASG